jgi:hypothetical protein
MVPISIWGAFSMKNKVAFQIICTDCGCLAVRIEDPINASRQAIVYCGDCGTARGTVGALRDLAVQPNTGIMTSKPRQLSQGPRSDGEISKLYEELQCLRRQIEIAESRALDWQTTSSR